MAPRSEAQVQSQLGRLVAFVGPISDQVTGLPSCSQRSQQRASLWRIHRDARWQGEGYETL